MGREYEPKVGQWYENLDEETMFRVVHVDEDEGIITLHYEDDDEPEEIDLDTWYEMDLDETDAPEGADDDEEDDEDWDEEDEEDEDWDDEDDEDEDEDWDDDEDDGSGSSRDDY